MADTQRLTMWGWFARAFAGGFGAMFGVMSALAVGGVCYYAIIAMGTMALSSFGGATVNPVLASGTTSIPWASAPECTSSVQAYQPQVYQPTSNQAPTNQAPTNQASSYPYYTAQAPADFVAPQPAVNHIPLENAAAEPQPDTNPK